MVGPVDHFAHHVQMRGLLQVEHLAADQCRGLGEPAQGERPQDRVGLDADVIVHEQDLGAVGVAQRLQHHPAVPPEPPRFGWLKTDSRPPSAAAAASNPAWSLALSVPWSTTITAPMTRSTSGSEVSGGQCD